MRRVKCKNCGVRNEKLAFLSTNTRYTLRFAMRIGRLCRAMTIQDVAREMRLDWHAVEDLDKIYMRAGHPAPRVIGIDEISIRKKHVYRIVVSDLEQKRAIWFGGEGRREEDMDQFYAFLGHENTANLRLAVMDMWLPFRKSMQAHAPNASVLFDKFHILRHLGEALDKVRKTEYAGSSLNHVGKGIDFVIPRFAGGWLAVSEKDARHRSFPAGLGSDVTLEGDAQRVFGRRRQARSALGFSIREPVRVCGMRTRRLRGPRHENRDVAASGFLSAWRVLARAHAAGDLPDVRRSQGRGSLGSRGFGFHVVV
jgi:hypothetical protein